MNISDMLNPISSASNINIETQENSHKEKTLRTFANEALGLDSSENDINNKSYNLSIKYLGLNKIDKNKKIEIIAKKPLQVMFTVIGDDDFAFGTEKILRVAVELIDASSKGNEKVIKNGLIDAEKRRLNRHQAPKDSHEEVGKTTIFAKESCACAYREDTLTLKVFGGSVKKNIERQFKFELRLYNKRAKDNKFEVIDTAYSDVFSVLTHSSQTEKNRARVKAKA